MPPQHLANQGKTGSPSRMRPPGLTLRPGRPPCLYRLRPAHTPSLPVTDRRRTCTRFDAYGHVGAGVRATNEGRSPRTAEAGRGPDRDAEVPRRRERGPWSRLTTETLCVGAGPSSWLLPWSGPSLAASSPLIP